MKTNKERTEDAKRKEFWAIIETQNPHLYRALELAGGMNTRLLAVCASALVSIAMNKVKKLKKPNAWALFAGEQIKQGKTIKEAAKLWRSQKEEIKEKE